MQPHIRKVLPVSVVAALGLGVSVAINVVHHRLANDVNYASFCNVNASVNCDVVLSSSYATLAGVSVGTWALLYYLTMLGLSLLVAWSDSAQVRARLAVVAVIAAVWDLLFSFYMATIAFAVLHTVCLMCAGLYLVSIAMFVATWRLHASLRIVGRRQAAARTGRDRSVLIGSIVAAVALIVIGSWEAFGRGARPLDAAEIERQRPDFFRWFFAQPVAQVPLDGSNTRGSSTAHVTIVEFSDFECGHCAAFHQALEDVLRRSDHDVRVVFHHFPLDSACNPKIGSPFHAEACLAAVAAECAAEQNKFWEYHNLLFDNQQRLEREYLVSYAARLNLDVNRFTLCLGSEQARARVEHDAQTGIALGIESTPTVFINGRTIKGALERAQLIDALTLARLNR